MGAQTIGCCMGGGGGTHGLQGACDLSAPSTPGWLRHCLFVFSYLFFSIFNPVNHPSQKNRNKFIAHILIS